MRAPLDEQNVITANAQFWEQMLAMSLEPLASGDEFCLGVRHITSWVSLSGVWSGSIEVRLAERLAYEATAAMMAMPVDGVGEADALDASKEIANMIAGTLKSALPRPCSMTVPEASMEQESICRPPETEETLVVAFRHETGDLMVRVLEKAFEPASVPTP
jgi:CheY-specific phosphatase CheX